MTAVRSHAAALGLVGMLGASVGVSAQPVAPVAIRNARIVSVSGPPIDGGTIVLANGLIRAVGTRVDVPPEAVVIDGTGLTLYPGLIDALSDVGLTTGTPPATGGGPGAPRQAARPVRGPEDRPGSTPWLQAADEFRPDDRRVEAWRSGGITTVVAAPRGGIFPGQAAVVNLSGERREDAVVRSGVAVPVALTPPGPGSVFPGSLMGVFAYVRQVFLDTRHYADAARRYADNPRGRPRPEHDRTVQALQGALQARTPFLLPAASATQIDRVLAFGRELDVPVVLYGLHEGYAAAPRVARAKVPVLVSAKWPEKARDADPDADEPLRVLELRDQAPGTPAALAEQKIAFAFYSDGLASPSEFLANVRKAVKAGLAPDAALRALTLDAAQIYGVHDRLGSLEAGKIANVIAVQGDLLGDKAVVKHVFVDGRRFDVPADAGNGASATPGRSSSSRPGTGERR